MLLRQSVSGLIWRRFGNFRPSHLPITATTPFSPIFHDLNRRAPSAFLDKYLGNDEFYIKYKNDFKRVKREVRELKKTVNCVEENYDFFKTVMCLYEQKKLEGHRFSSYQDWRSDNLREAKEKYPQHDFPFMLESTAKSDLKLHTAHTNAIHQIIARIEEYDECHARLDEIRRWLPAKTPFDKVFLDMNDTKKPQSLRLYHLMTRNSGTMQNRQDEYSKLSPAELHNLQIEFDAVYQALIDKFVSTHMTVQQYEVDYNSDFEKVRRDVEFLMEKKLADATNYPFYISLESLHHHRRHCMKNKAVGKSSFEAHCRLVMSNFPGFELPAFLDLEVIPRDRDYRFHTQIMDRLRKKFDLAPESHIVGQFEFHNAPISPFAPLYFDWSRTKPAKPTQLWSTDQAGNQGQGNIVDLVKKYVTMDESVKQDYKVKRTKMKEQAISDFVAKHLTDDEFTAFYRRDFKQVSKSVSRSLLRACSMEQNEKFFRAIQKLYWSRLGVSRNSPERRGLEINQRLSSEHNRQLAEVQHLFPNHDFPVFTDLERDPKEAVYKYHINLWNTRIAKLITGNRPQVHAAADKLSPVSPFASIFYEYEIAKNAYKWSKVSADQNDEVEKKCLEEGKREQVIFMNKHCGKPRQNEYTQEDFLAMGRRVYGLKEKTKEAALYESSFFADLNTLNTELETFRKADGNKAENKRERYIAKVNATKLKWPKHEFPVFLSSLDADGESDLYQYHLRLFKSMKRKHIKSLADSDK